MPRHRGRRDRNHELLVFGYVRRIDAEPDGDTLIPHAIAVRCEQFSRPVTPSISIESAQSLRGLIAATIRQRFDENICELTMTDWAGLARAYPVYVF